MTKESVVVVTGGAGFLGSHMVDLLLARGFRVRVIDNLVSGREVNLSHHQSTPHLQLDRRDIRALAAKDALFRDARYVFHFAGIGEIVPSIENPAEYMSANVQGTVHVLEGARWQGVSKFVYAASSSCYGMADVPTAEDHPVLPLYPYALSKYLGELSAFHWRRVYGLPVNSIRIFSAYGTRSQTSGAYGAVFGVFLRQKLAGKPFTVVGDGTQCRDFVFATDVAEAFLLAAEKPPEGQVYNLGTGNPQTVNRLVELLGGEKVFIPKRPGEPIRTWANIEKIKAELGWKAGVSFEEGVALIKKNIECWREAPLWDPESIAEATKVWAKYMGADQGL